MALLAYMSLEARWVTGDSRNLLKRKLGPGGTKVVQFSDSVMVRSIQTYDRTVDKPWNRLSEGEKAKIRLELNNFKATEMEVHRESLHMIRFHAT